MQKIITIQQSSNSSHFLCFPSVIGTSSYTRFDNTKAGTNFFHETSHHLFITSLKLFSTFFLRSDLIPFYSGCVDFIDNACVYLARLWSSQQKNSVDFFEK